MDKEPKYEEDGVHKVTGEMKPICFTTNDNRDAVIAILSSSLFFLNYIIWSSCQVVNSRDFNFDFDMSSINNDILSKLAKFGRLLQKDYQKNSVIKRRVYAK